MNRRCYPQLSFRISLLVFGVLTVCVSCSSDIQGDLPAQGAIIVNETSVNTEPTISPTPFDGVAGSLGVNDSYFPTLGNGGYDVKRYDLDLTWDPDERFLSGKATIEADLTEDLVSLNFDLSGMTVKSVELGSVELRFVIEGNELTVFLPSPTPKETSISLIISYEGHPGLVENLNLPYAGGWFNSDRGVLVVGEPSSSQAWHPVNDHPTDRSHFRISMTVPSPLVVVTNGKLISETTLNGDTTWVYQTMFEQAPYLTTLAIGDFIESEHGVFQDVFIRHWFERGIPNPSLSDTDFDAMLRVFNELFGQYPFSYYGFLAINQNLGFALETQTLSVFGKDTVADEQIQVHELAHQWFGNYITVADWSDIWLNEGFATYAEQLYFEEIDPSYSIDDSFFKYVYSLVEQGNTSLVLPPPGKPGPSSIFSASVYVRGAMTLHALRLELGDPLFFATLRSYVSQFGGRSASIDDFILLAEDISDLDLDSFFSKWLFTDELPPLSEVYG